jgi:hypothetical protein
VTVSGDLCHAEMQVDERSRAFERTLTVPPGAHVVEFRREAPPGSGKLVLSVTDAAVIEEWE